MSLRPVGQSSNFSVILVGERQHKVLGQIGSKLVSMATESSHRLMGKCPEDSDIIFYWIFVKLASKEDSHKILNELDFGPDRTTHFGVTRP